MNRAAKIALAVLCIVLAVWGAQRFKMGACDIKYELITPDGWTLDFAGPAFSPGTSDSLMAHEGFGLPPVDHVTQEIYQMPGALMLDTIVKPRVVTITTTTHGISPKAMHAARAKLMDAMRWNRGTRGQPSILRYTVNGTSRDLYVHYAGDVRRSIGRYGQMEIIGFRLTAYDPMFYDPVTQEQVLDYDQGITCLLVMKKGEHEAWDNLGPPAAAAAGSLPWPYVYCLHICPRSGDLYVGGDFTNWAGLGAGPGDHIARYDGATWFTVGGGLSAAVTEMDIAPDGTIYLVGDFQNAGDGAGDYVAQYDPETDTFSNLGGGPGAAAVTTVDDVVIGHDGTVYIIGNFTNWAGLGSPAGDHIARIAPGGAWASVGGGFDSWGRCLAVGLNGNVFAGGNFGAAGGIAECNYIAEYNIATGTWEHLDEGVGAAVYDCKVGPDGTLYIGGNFITVGVAAATANRIASWNGVVWSPLGDGLTGSCTRIAIKANGEIWASGTFGRAGDITTNNRIARWNRYSWMHVDALVPLTGPVWRLHADGDDMYFGINASAASFTLYVAAESPIVVNGNMMSYPIIEVKNAGLLEIIRNDTTGHELQFDYEMIEGEIVIIDLSAGVKTVISNWRGNVLGEALPNSDLGTFKLESSPRARHGSTQGANLIAVFIKDPNANNILVPRESGDNNNQLSGWENITGISQDNTELGRLYVSIVFDGVDYHVELYMDPGKAAGKLVGHTADYAAPGAQAIIADNASGLGGTITIDAVVGPDTDIDVIFTIVTMLWQDRWLDADNAVS